MEENELLKYHKEYKAELKRALLNAQKRLDKNASGLKRGTLKYKTGKNGNYYYSLLLTDGSGGKKCRYLKKIDRAVAAEIAQCDYDRKLISKAGRLLELLDKFDSETEKGGIDSVLDNTIAARRRLITPARKSSRIRQQEWECEEYEPKSFGDNTPEFITDRGERVRSKSEIIIANALAKHKIPYKYECPLNLDGHIIHPDFTLFNPKNGKLIYWEHLGMLDDMQYRQDAMKRIALYENSGIFSGSELILTLESYSLPLTPSAVERKIAKYLS